MQRNEISKLIRKRRSVYPKQFTGEKVDNQIIMDMLKNANWAPTHRLTEPWRFMVFEDEGLQSFANFQAGHYERQAKINGTFNRGKYEKLKSKPLACSHIIAISMRRDPKESVPEVEEIMAVACAVQNMWLTAAAHSIGCYWSTGGVTYEKGVNEFFGLGEKDRLLGFLMIGMPKEYPAQTKRGEIEEKISWVSTVR